MRILHCIPSFAGGGAERQCVQLCAELSRDGHEVHLAYVMRGSTDYLDRLGSANVHLHQLGTGGDMDLYRAQKSPVVLWRLYRLVSRLRPDIVQSWNRPMDAFVGVVAYARRTNWVLSERNAVDLYTDQREKLRVWLARRASAVAANSPGGAADWKNRLGGAVPSHVIPNIVYHDALIRDQQPVAWPQGFPPRRTIVYAGRFEPQKNIPVMLEGLRLAMSLRDVWAILCGTGDLLQPAQQEVSRWPHASRVHFAGFVPKPWQLMKQAGGLILVSRCEGHPNIVTEAMVVRCPVLVSDIPAHRAILDDSSALFVPTDQPRAVAEGIRRLLDEPQASTARAARAFDASQAWRPEQVVQKYERLYQDILSSRGPAR
jgi:glycosyltransferase involved in cell wall biosynthesis